MAWTTPGTAVAGAVLEADFWNSNVRDNSLALFNAFNNAQVTTVTAATFSTTSASFVDITGLSVSITPTSASSKVLVFATVSLGPDTAGNSKFGFTISGGNIANIDGVAVGSRVAALSNFSYSYGDSNTMFPLSYVLIDQPATTSAVTYQARISTHSTGGIKLNRSFTDTDASTVYRGSSHIGAIELIG